MATISKICCPIPRYPSPLTESPNPLTHTPSPLSLPLTVGEEDGAGWEEETFRERFTPSPTLHSSSEEVSEEDGESEDDVRKCEFIALFQRVFGEEYRLTGDPRTRFDNAIKWLRENYKSGLKFRVKELDLSYEGLHLFPFTFLSWFPNLTSVDLSFSHINKVQFSQIMHLSGLKFINLSNTPFAKSPLILIE
jgi:hypothetical protein